MHQKTNGGKFASKRGDNLEWPRVKDIDTIPIKQSLNQYLLCMHCVSDIRSSVIRSNRLFGQFLDGTERHGVSYNTNYLILGPKYWIYGQF